MIQFSILIMLSSISRILFLLFLFFLCFIFFFLFYKGGFYSFLVSKLFLFQKILVLCFYFYFKISFIKLYFFHDCFYCRLNLSRLYSYRLQIVLLKHASIKICVLLSSLKLFDILSKDFFTRFFSI